jgi:hypothetical protein
LLDGIEARGQIFVLATTNRPEHRWPGGLDLRGRGVTQFLDLTLLAPDIQERILFSESVDGVEPMSESALREVVRLEDWANQRVAPSL